MMVKFSSRVLYEHCNEDEEGDSYPFRPLFRRRCRRVHYCWASYRLTRLTEESASLSVNSITVRANPLVSSVLTFFRQLYSSCIVHLYVFYFFLFQFVVSTMSRWINSMLILKHLMENFHFQIITLFTTSIIYFIDQF